MIERADPETARELILEYVASLGVDLSFQDFEHEVANLDRFYELILVGRAEARPHMAEARPHMAEAHPHMAYGCVALRRIDDDTCEMKRLYVRKDFRGQNLGRALVERVIEEARQRGYKRMRLDTLPSMGAATELYRQLGFVEIEPYRFNPVEGSKFMELRIER